MNEALLNPEVQQFITDLSPSDLKELAFKKSPFQNVSILELMQQADGHLRTAKKLPTWHNTPGIIYPAKLSIEQSSSELTAKYKSSLLKGSTVADLTGGYGVDSFYFSKIGKYITHCEVNAELSQIAEHNAAALGAENITFFSGDGINFLKNSTSGFGTIYVDPSRRVKSQKVFKLADCEPDVAVNLDFLLEKADRIIIKTAPLLDLKAGLTELRSVSQIHILSVKNDCKELLWVVDKDFVEEEPEIICIALDEKVNRDYRFKLSHEQDAIPEYSEAQQYIYEPDVALLKAGCFKSISFDFGLKKLHQHTHLYTSTKLKEFIGKRLELTEAIDYGTFLKTKPVSKANVICRNFPESPETLKKNLKIKDGGEQYLYFTTDIYNNRVVLRCFRID